MKHLGRGTGASKTREGESKRVQSADHRTIGPSKQVGIGGLAGRRTECGQWRVQSGRGRAPLCLAGISLARCTTYITLIPATSPPRPLSRGLLFKREASRFFFEEPTRENCIEQ